MQYKKGHSTILAKKSWHVGKSENIAKVREDERKHAAKQALITQRSVNAEREARFTMLQRRKKAAKEKTDVDTTTALHEDGVLWGSGHINFFADVDRAGNEEAAEAAIADQAAKAEAEKRAAALKSAEEKGVALGWGSGELEGDRKKFWQLAESGAGLKVDRDRFDKDFDSRRRRREADRREAADPLNVINEMVGRTERHNRDKMLDRRIAGTIPPATRAVEMRRPPRQEPTPPPRQQREPVWASVPMAPHLKTAPQPGGREPGPAKGQTSSRPGAQSAKDGDQPRQRSVVAVLDESEVSASSKHRGGRASEKVVTGSGVETKEPAGKHEPEPVDGSRARSNRRRSQRSTHKDRRRRHKRQRRDSIPKDGSGQRKAAAIQEARELLRASRLQREQAERARERDLLGSVGRRSHVQR